ncbi:MAG TPA: phytase [Lacipirellulaceae bacterium]|jgi:3-phytase|nr:phytase [Lacipirellulaceae bacterium]
MRRLIETPRGTIMSRFVSTKAKNRALRFEALESRAMTAVAVVTSVETVAASGGEDDAAIWIHPTDTAQSRVIGAVKTGSNALQVFNLSGQLVQSVAVSNINNIDLRYNFPVAGQSVALLAGSNRSNNSIALYRIDSQTGLLEDVAARTISTGMAIYGCAMYVSPVSRKYYVFVSSESGQLQQWELFDNGAGKVDARQVRSFAVGSQSEGLVADDVLQQLYVGEENVGIWKYSAEPDGGASRTLVDHTGAGGHLVADVEGLTIYYGNGGTGYLLASSQGSNEFVVYGRDGNNAFVGSFALVASDGIDAVTDTDGIDVTNFALGSQFPQGLFIAQDNDDNFKLARWDAVDAAFGGVLIADISWDPRLVGRAQQPPALPGDYNSSHRVDTADYVVWRKTVGQSVTPYSGADGNGNGRVDDGDYGVWRAYSGQILASATVIATENSQAAQPATAMVGFPFSLDMQIRKVSRRPTGQWADFELAELHSGRNTWPLVLTLLKQESNPPANRHDEVAARRAPNDVQSESRAIDAAFELQFPAVSPRASGLNSPSL